MHANEIYLNPPGEARIFELIVAYCYGSTILMGPSTIVAIWCASEFFKMTWKHYKGNLCRRSHLYFQDVILKNWEDAIGSLCSYKGLHAITQELEIVRACYTKGKQIGHYQIREHCPGIYLLTTSLPKENALFKNVEQRGKVILYFHMLIHCWLSAY